jgi:hypothetical protein
MNWILNTYSDVYATAMMSDSKGEHHVASAKVSTPNKRPAVFGLFRKR